MSTLPTQAPGSGLLPAPPEEPGPEIDYESLVTEDHKPFESIFIEKLCRLLTRPLYASWAGPGPGRPFLVQANVGWFYQRKTPAVVPDVLLSLDVTGPQDLQVKQGHSYYQWDLGKPPDVIIEAVSDRTGGEESFKKNLYARLGVAYYAVFDPRHLLSDDTLRVYELLGRVYRPGEAGPWATIGLGLAR
jgi:Uma2 family endonuclease